MEDRGGGVRVDGDCPNRNERNDRCRRARDGKRDDSCHSSVVIGAARTESVPHRASPRPQRGTPGTPDKVLRDGDVVGVTPWRPGGQTVVSSALSALVWTGPGSQQLLEQDLLITMPAASPFRRPGQPQTCPFGSKMVRCRAQRRGQRTLGAFHDFSRSLSGWGAPNYGISTGALRAGIFAHGHYAEQ